MSSTEKPAPLGHRRSSRYLECRQGTKRRIRTKRCPICELRAEDWDERRPGDHFARDDHTWERLVNSIPTEPAPSDAPKVPKVPKPPQPPKVPKVPKVPKAQDSVGVASHD